MDMTFFTPSPKAIFMSMATVTPRAFGKKSEGGMIADLTNDTILTESDVLIGV